MNFELVLLPAMIIIGPELRTTWMNNECHQAIPAFWQQIYSHNTLQNIPNKIDSNTVLGLYTNYSEDFSLTSGYYSLVVGCPVTSSNDIPHNMVSIQIPAGKYAVFTAKGPFHPAIANVWLNEIWKSNLDRTFTYDFEWYDSQSTNDENSIVKIYISIK